MNNSQIDHEVKIHNRSFLSVTDIIKIISFNNSEFIIESGSGLIHITGENLALDSFEEINKMVKISGKIDCYEYIDKNKKAKESFISKLFK